MRLNRIRRALRLLHIQALMIQERDLRIKEYERLILQHQRSLLDLAIGFRVALEIPEVDLRDDIDRLIRDLELGIAMSEEHVV